MPRKPRILGLLLRRGLLVAAGFLTTVGAPAAAADQDPRARLRETARDRRADAAVSAGDQGETS